MTTEKTEFTYDELSPEAQERARDKWREGALDHEWWDSTYDDCKEVGKLLGIQIENIYFRGFSSQGDGACFEGTWSARNCKPKEAKEYAPKDYHLNYICDQFGAVAENWPDASFRCKHIGHYYHEHSTDIEVSIGEDEDVVAVKARLLDLDVSDFESALENAARDFMRWIYSRLEAEHDYLLSDEAVAESIRNNEYTFDEEGERL